MKEESIRIAVVQMNSTEDMEKNLVCAEHLLEKARATGARIVALPENFACMGTEAERSRYAQDLEGPILSFLQSCARRFSVAIVGGSFLERAEASCGNVFNTSVLVDASGALVAVYRKIHLFDAEVAAGCSYKESSYVKPGAEIVAAPIEGIVCGLTLCYDLRFPELYRHLTMQGARVIFVPSAFTAVTGKDHWFPLLQARAIENQVYIAAPAQCGRHGQQHFTYGHAAIVDPWGIVVAQAACGESVVTYDVVPSYQDEVRTRMPVLRHVRGDLYPVAGMPHTRV